MQEKAYELAITTQGPTYPASEIMDESGNFIVIGRVNQQDDSGNTISPWECAVVAQDSPMPPFGKQVPYNIIKKFTLDDLNGLDDTVLHTLPMPLPGNNYPITFAPDQCNQMASFRRPSYPLHRAYIPDMRIEDGPRDYAPITLGNWVKAKGQCVVSLCDNQRAARFDFKFSGMIPDSLYTVMSLRENDLNPVATTRPGPLGIPNVFITDSEGNAEFWAKLPNPFPTGTNTNRVVNVIVLWMSTRMSYGGAIGINGLGGDIHAQLKLTGPSFLEFETY